LTFTDPVSIDRALPFTTKYEYDGLGRTINEIDANGAIKCFVYDDADNIINTGIRKTVDESVQVLQINSYDLAGRMTSQTDGNGNTTYYEYNTFSKLGRTISPSDESIASNSTTYQYDVMGNLAKQCDSTGLTGLLSYDTMGRLLSQTHQDVEGTEGITTAKRYDKNGNVRFETDGNGNETEYTYDALNRLRTVSAYVNGAEKLTSYEYDADGNQTCMTDWRGNKSTSVYDALGRLIKKYDPYALIQRLEYNKNNVQIKSEDALGRITQYIYDKNNRLIASVDPEGHTTSKSYDDAGNVKTETDGRNISVTYNYDELGRLVSVVNAKSEASSYTYDLNGNMLTQTDGNGNTTVYEYNVVNKLIRRVDHGGKIGSVYINEKTESYSYYPDGSIKSKIDRNGIRTDYSYDVFGRLLSLTAGSTAIGYTYDGNGNQLTVTDSTGTTRRTYDELNRTVTKEVPAIGLTTYTYDGIETEGMYSEITTDPKGNAVKKVYDKVGRLVNVIADGDTTTYTYYADGSRKSVIYGSGAKEEYTYYSDGLIKTLANKKPDGTVIDSYSYTYDGAHNQTSKTDSKGTTNYSYDSLNRLERVAEPNGRATSYTYDKAGNRKTETATSESSATITTYTYNEQNRLMKTLTNSGSTAVIVNYIYDSNGNMVNSSTETVKPVDPDSTGSFSVYEAGTVEDSTMVFYKYDALNQLTEIITGDKIEKYMYNGDGYRVVKNDNEQIINYLYEYDKVILETDSAGNQLARNVYGTNLISRTSNLDNLYYMYNGHADVTSLITADGTIAASYYYDAFGTITEQSGDVDNSITYAGYQYDNETGLYYLNARYYDSKIARFLSEDTYRGHASDPLSLNLYTYCANNPIMYWDPTGHEMVTKTWEGYVVTVDSEDKAYADWAIFTGNAYADKMYIDESVTLDTINTGSGLQSNIVNYGSIGEVSTGAGSLTVINNKGNINEMNTGENSVMAISNRSFMGTITTGVYSTLNINNNGVISRIITGAKSTNEINNEGAIDSLITGDGNHTTIGGMGLLGSSSGNGKLFWNRVEDTAARFRLKFIMMNQYPYTYLAMTNVLYRNALEIRIQNSINCVTKNKDLINSVAKEYDVPSEVIAGIILKEMYTQSLPDNLSKLYRKYTNPEKKTTVGLGAISVDGARTAWFYYDKHYYTNKSANIPADYDDAINKIQYDDRYNIETICAILYQISNDVRGNKKKKINELSQEEIRKIVYSYNIKKGYKYTNCVMEYLPDLRILLR
jgi:RHS repeat-associated protein